MKPGPLVPNTPKPKFQLHAIEIRSSHCFCALYKRFFIYDHMSDILKIVVLVVSKLMLTQQYMITLLQDNTDPSPFCFLYTIIMYVGPTQVQRKLKFWPSSPQCFVPPGNLFVFMLNKTKSDPLCRGSCSTLLIPTFANRKFTYTRDLPFLSTKIISIMRSGSVHHYRTLKTSRYPCTKSCPFSAGFDKSAQHLLLYVRNV